MPQMGMDLRTVILITTNPTETYELKDGKWESFDYNPDRRYLNIV